jgi:hypothetical protein
MEFKKFLKNLLRSIFRLGPYRERDPNISSYLLTVKAWLKWQMGGKA